MTDAIKQPVGQPTFRHLDDPDVQFMNVRAQRNADGSESFVREKWLAIGLLLVWFSQYQYALPRLRATSRRMKHARRTPIPSLQSTTHA